MLPPPSKKLIAHVDMNSFFASVEQQADPTLRGKALGVCAYLHRHGCVIAASIEAKRQGMKVGMTMEEAKERVPKAVFIENDPPKYRAVSSRVFGILQSLTDSMEIYSIDEAFLDLTGWYRDSAEATWALARARQRITNEVGDWLRCSIGIAPTRFLAKTASDIEKPNGLVVIDYDNLDEILSKLDLEDVCGIGPRIRRRLERAGIHSLMELKHYPVANLIRLFGKYGFYLWCKLHGMEVERITNIDLQAPKSIGHSYCVPDRVNREGKVVAVLTRLTERAGRRLRQGGFLAGTIAVAVGFKDGNGGSDFVHFDEPVADSFTLVGASCDLLKRMWLKERVGFLAVTLSDFSEPNGQESFSFKISRGDSHFKKASQAMDLVRDRYGDSAIMFGSMMKLGDEAPDRIGYRKIK